MNVTAQRLRRNVLSLPPRERASLARDLILSLEGAADEGAAAAWDDEIERRVRKIRSGAVAGRPADEVFKAIKARHA